MKKIVVWMTVISIGSILLVGCSSNENQKEKTIENEEITSNDDNVEEEKQEDNDNQSKQAIEYTDSNQEDNSSESDLPNPIEIDEEITHPNGVTMTIKEVRFKEDSIAIDFSAEYNKGDDGIYIAENNQDGGLTLVDDNETEYGFIPPKLDYDLFLATGDSMEGTLSFLGKLKEEANTLTLTFNPDFSESDKDEDRPKFKFEIDVK